MRLGTVGWLIAIGLAGCNSVQMDQPAPDPMPDLMPAPPDLGDNGEPSSVYPAPHQAPPQVVTAGGPVLAEPVIVPVFFANDDPTEKAALEDFYAQLGGSSYFLATGQEYGVGAATATPPVEVAEMPDGTLDDSAIQTWLAGKLNADDPLFPAPTQNSVYMLDYPANVTITLKSGMGTSESCMSFGGYHQGIRLDATHGRMNVAYAVIPRCSGAQGLDVLATTTSAASHELVEAATDPYPQNLPGFGQVDDDHLYWMFAIGGGEVGDLCAQDPTSFQQLPGLDYTVQRSWSNASAMAGHDPCVPTLANEVYFNAVPVLEDTITLGGSYTMRGVQIPVGSSKTIDLQLFSDGDTHGAWSVKAIDAQQLQGGKSSSFNFKLDRDSGRNGEKLHLTIESVKAGQYGAGIFAVVSKLGARTHYWFGLVGQ